jgi:hypothetical protein
MSMSGRYWYCLARGFDIGERGTLMLVNGRHWYLPFCGREALILVSGWLWLILVSGGLWYWWRVGFDTMLYWWRGDFNIVLYWWKGGFNIFDEGFDIGVGYTLGYQLEWWSGDFDIELYGWIGDFDFEFKGGSVREGKGKGGFETSLALVWGTNTTLDITSASSVSVRRNDATKLKWVYGININKAGTCS